MTFSNGATVNLPIVQDLMGRQYEMGIGNIVVRAPARHSPPSPLRYYPLCCSVAPKATDSLSLFHLSPPLLSSNIQWDAAVAMHRFFQTDFPPGHFEGKTILELGSGTGLGTEV